MEVGAVKQAFNNEVIFLKKKLNQAKIHVIHKLTRKAKTLLEKKAPVHLKEKLKRKAESAVNEVLIIKKIKAKDIAKFIITHTGELKDYLNRPKVDNDKACARLVLHKSLEDKYTFFRNRFGNVPIKDLFMSRQERRKIKKEAREQQKNKKKGKEGKVNNATGDWDIEDVEMGNDNKIRQGGIGDSNIEESEHSEADINEESDDENDAEVENGDNIENGIDENHNSQSDKENSDDEAEDDDNDGSHDDDDDEAEEDDDNGGSHDDDDNEVEVGKYIKLKPVKEIKESVDKPKLLKSKNFAKIAVPEIDNLKAQKKPMDKKVKGNKESTKKIKDNKNKNLKEKLQNRKFKKDEDSTQVEGRKVVDPFFITASGGNYLSLAEPRQPDEVKEIHKRGNRKERRAVMFGHVANIRPKTDNFRQNNNRSNKFEGQDSKDRGLAGGFRNNGDRFHKSPSFNGRSNKFNDDNSKFNDRNAHNGRNKFNDSNTNLNNSSNEKKDEKLHPSWEAKKKLKSAMSLLPAQGKKTVFNDS